MLENRRWMYLNAYTNDIDTVIAESVEDAWTVWSEYSGEKREDYEDDGIIFSRLDRDEEWFITNYDGKDNTKTQTIGEWIIEQGRGFLSSTEY